MDTLEKCYLILNVPFDPNDIERGHRIRLSYTGNHSGKKVKSIIIKFRSYHGKLVNFFIKVDQGITLMVFSVSVDLTKRRFLLLTKARGLIKRNTNISYVYSDINCSLGLRFKDNSFKYYNNEKELHHLSSH